MPESPFALAPKLAELNTDVLFGDIWERPELSKRDRSLITVASLVSLYRTEQLGYHLNRALENGLTRDELVEAITHLAFYAGWPTAVTALTRLQDVLNTTDDSGPRGARRGSWRRWYRPYSRFLRHRWHHPLDSDRNPAWRRHGPAAENAERHRDCHRVEHGRRHGAGCTGRHPGRA